MFKKVKLKHRVYIACIAWLIVMIFNHEDMYLTFACGTMFIE